MVSLNRKFLDTTKCGGHYEILVSLPPECPPWLRALLRMEPDSCPAIVVVLQSSSPPLRDELLRQRRARIRRERARSSVPSRVPFATKLWFKLFIVLLPLCRDSMRRWTTCSEKVDSRPFLVLPRVRGACCLEKPCAGASMTNNDWEVCRGKNTNVRSGRTRELKICFW